MDPLNSLSRRLEKANILTRSTEARKWLAGMATGMSKVGTSGLLNNSIRQVKELTPGKMYFFAYDPKTKTKMPYYDRFPLVLPCETYADGFLGLNLHYIAPPYRAKLLDKLMDVASNKKFNDSTRLRISYDLLNSSSRYAIFRPCVKKYLYKQMRSKFIYITASEWDIAIFLPFERFVGASRQQVFNDSEELM